MLTYTAVLTMIKRADFQSYLNSPIPKKSPTQTSMQYKQRLQALDPSRSRQADTSAFKNMISPNYSMSGPSYNIMTQPGGTQRQAEMTAAGQGVKDYYKNTTLQQQARNAGAATVGAATGIAKGFLATPFIVANVAGKAMDYAGKPLGISGIQNGIRQVTGGVRGALDSVNNAASGYFNAQKGVAGAASGIAEIGTAIATPGAGDMVIASKPIGLLTKSMNGTVKQFGAAGLNQGFSFAAQ